MKKMRDIYAVSFVKLVDSAWMPKVEMKTFKGFRLGGSDDHIRIKTSANQEPAFEPISVQKFSSKEEFISHMVQESIKVWDKYESEKQFEKESQVIIEDIDSGNEPKDSDIFLDDEDDYARDFYDHEPLDLENASDDDIADRVKEIKSRNAGSWEPYMILREVYGVDIIREPDIATEEDAERVRNARPDPENNNGLVRRARSRRRGV
jgi:hypothetical protein